jgi:hypothetical protein
VTHVGRKRRHMRAASTAVLWTLLQRADRKRVSQIVQTRAALPHRDDVCTLASLSKVSLTAR